jgi:ferredoxin--NADP+ reductase
MSQGDHTTLTRQRSLNVIEIRDLTSTAFVLRMERGDIAFRPGQCVILGLPGKQDMREYSIYSAADEPHLEVLIKLVDEGSVSRQLKKCTKGDTVLMEGPVGFFTLRDKDIATRRFVLIASGTGIAPFHSMVGSYPALYYSVLHGVREGTEAYDRGAFASEHYTLCTSRDETGDFHGRVTDYLRQHPGDPSALYQLCGNVIMIDDVCDILEGQEVPVDNIRSEVYF